MNKLLYMKRICTVKILFSVQLNEVRNCGWWQIYWGERFFSIRRLELLARQTSPRKRSPRKTPKKSPRKKIRTPSSSARKRLSLQLHMLTSNLDKAGFTKRALFQSPDNDRTVKSTSKTCLQSKKFCVQSLSNITKLFITIVYSIS